jgi:tetratricopeptide (TPR) repeat protein
VLANDLTGIRHVKERIVALASRYEGWRAFAHLAEAQYLRACGRAEAALPELEAAIAAAAYDPADPTRVTLAWPAAVSTYVDVLQDLGRDDEALQCGEGALQTCRELGSAIAAHGIIRSLALVRAKLGDASAASEQLERLIEEQRALGVRGLQLGATYEARTRVAFRANDPSAIARYGQLTAAEYRNATGSALLSRYESLLSDAERHGAGELPALSDLRSTAEIETQ